MTWFKVTLFAAACFMVTAAPARADLFISPTFGAATGGVVRDGSKVTFGGQMGVIGDGALGFEADYGYTAKTRGGNGHDNFRTIGAALLVAPGAFGSEKFRPYVAVGGGLIGAVTQTKHIFTVGGDEVESAPVVSAGGGVFAFLSPHVGIRVDARYFRAMVDGPASANATKVSPHFIRASGGLVVRF